MHQLPNSSKNCLSIGLHRLIQMCGLQCSKGSRRKSSLVSLSRGLNVYMIYIFSAEFSLTCGALFCGLNCTANTRLGRKSACKQSMSLVFMISMQIAQLSLSLFSLGCSASIESLCFCVCNITNHSAITP